MTPDPDNYAALRRMKDDFVRAASMSYHFLQPSRALLFVKWLDDHAVYVCGYCHFVYAHEWIFDEGKKRHVCCECGCEFNMDIAH
jgi:hypothetical protein